AYESVFQDPQEWIRAGKHDLVVPMMYYQHEHFFPFVDNWQQHNGGRLVVPGLGAYRMLEKEGNWSLSDLTEQLDYLRAAGTAGFAFSGVHRSLIISKDCMIPYVLIITGTRCFFLLCTG
ncbi:MAG: hypothetical protein LUJ25_00995, partial [Firmicutes bacterium]|nr:hypothetical protein [Bacillota bacterium]